jgi:hypothetical protein
MVTITTEARTVLARLELLQHGTTTRYDPAKGSRNSEAPLVPPGESDPPHERWRRAMDAAPEEGLALVVQRATDELSASLRRPLAPITPDTMGELKDRILACDGFAPREIAYALRCAERLVRVTRMEAGRHAESGRTVKQSDGLDRADQARALVASGMSYRQAAAVIGVAHTTISRWLD